MILSKSRSFIDKVIAVLFVIFAILQVNDPDPYLWIAIYMLIPCLSFAHLLKYDVHIYARFILVVLLIFLLTYLPALYSWAGIGFPSIASKMKSDSLYIELVREAIGLLLCCIVSGYYGFKKN